MGDKPSRLPLEDGWSLEISRNGQKCNYDFYDEGGTKSSTRTGEIPSGVTSASGVGREIIKHLHVGKKYTKEYVRDEVFPIVMRTLNEMWIEALERETQARERAQREEEERLKRELMGAEMFLNSTENPLLWIANGVGWLTAGEKRNIMLAFVGYSSQIVLQTPVSVIFLGEGASGKSHIQSMALDLMPKSSVLYEKSITEAVMYRRAMIDPYFYDGKIVNYGDMGGMTSHTDVGQAKDMLKELQSEGYLSKPLNVPTADGWEVQEIELFGYPCLTYTTVPNHSFDDQELSRSMFIEPRQDNRRVFETMFKMIESGGRTKHKIAEVRAKLNKIPFILQRSREHSTNVEIMNPYHSVLDDLLGGTEFYKRDRPKYTTILKTITAINGFKRDTHEFYGKEYLFTTWNDVQLFSSMLKPYMGSIQYNVSPPAKGVLDDIVQCIDGWSEQKKLTRDYKFTTNEYYNISGTHKSKRSVQRYFSELSDAGLIEATGTVGKSVLYRLNEEVKLQAELKLEWTDKDRDMVAYELCDEAVEIIELDEPTEGLSIHTNTGDFGTPPWEQYDII